MVLSGLTARALTPPRPSFSRALDVEDELGKTKDDEDENERGDEVGVEDRHERFGERSRRRQAAARSREAKSIKPREIYTKKISETTSGNGLSSTHARTHSNAHVTY
jgi:hypothetical protein